MKKLSKEILKRDAKRDTKRPGHAARVRQGDEVLALKTTDTKTEVRVRFLEVCIVESPL